MNSLDGSLRICSYGMTCYELLTETVPFSGIAPLLAAQRASSAGSECEVQSSRPELIRCDMSEESSCLVELIEWCWGDEVKSRPRFHDVVKHISDRTKEEVDVNAQDVV